MIKIFPFAVVILAALWFVSGAFAHENKHWSNSKEFDFYFDDKSLNESTRQDDPPKAETTEFNKNSEHKSVAKTHSEGTRETFAVGKLKKLIHYFLSLLYTINDNNNYEREKLHDNKLERENTKLKTNRTSTMARIYQGSSTQKIRDTDSLECENSGEGKDSEYYDEGNSFKNSEMNILNSSIEMKSKVRNRGRVSGGQQKNSSDNQNFTSEDFQSDRRSVNLSTLRSKEISGEFIDEYINPPTGKVLKKSYELPLTNQPIISNGKENQTIIPLKENSKEKNFEIDYKKDINSQNSVSDKIAKDMNTTLNKGLGKEEFSFNESKKSDNTTLKTLSSQTGDLKKKNFKKTSAVENTTQNSFPSNTSALLISEKPQNNENNTLKIIPLSTVHISKIPDENSSSPEEIKLAHSQKPEILAVKNDVYDSSPENFSFSDYSQEDQSVEENIPSSDHQVQSKETSDKAEKIFSQQPLNNTNSFVMAGEFNETNTLVPQNSFIDTDSKSDMDIPSERHSVKHPIPEEKDPEAQDISTTSEELKMRTDSNTDSDSSEYNDSEELYEYDEYYDDDDVQLMSNFTNYFNEIFSNATTQSSENFTSPLTNYSMEIELPTSSKNDTKINIFPKTKGIFNSILEFLYKYSNSTWIKKMKGENGRM